MFGILAALRAPSRLLQKYPTASPLPVPPERGDPEDQGYGDEPGSNALARAGTKTTSGRPILLGNPHLGWSSLYWEAHTTVRDRVNFYGSQRSRSPGHLCVASRGRAAGRIRAQRPHAANQAVVEVKREDGSLASEEREYEGTPLGPNIHRTGDHVFVVRSVNVEWLRQYEGFFELMYAESLGGFRSILGRRLAVASNYTYADVDGNILYAWNARLPHRSDTSINYSLDVPGDTGRFFWKGVHRLRDLQLWRGAVRSLPGSVRRGGVRTVRNSVESSLTDDDAPGTRQPCGGACGAGTGDVWVLLVHFTRPVVTAWSVLAYGQTMDLSSPHSRDQIELFANHQLRPVWFTEEAIAAHLERRYRPGGVILQVPSAR
jgi:acyl-homoserine lactone acylase PvdQ